MRDLAASWIAGGNLFGPALLDYISKPLQDTGRMLEALDLWRGAANLYRRLYEAAPDSADLARDLSASLNKLGIRRFRVAIDRRLHEAAPDSANLAVSYVKMAALADKSGDASEALAWARRARDVLDGLKRRGAFLSPEDEAMLGAMNRALGE